MPIWGMMIVNNSKQITDDSQPKVPIVMRFIGNSRSFISGFTKVLIMVKTIAATTRILMSDWYVKPGNIPATSQIEKIFININCKNFFT